MKERYQVLHVPDHIKKILVKQDALITHKPLLQQRKSARLALGSSRVLSTSDWKFVPVSIDIEWDSFSFASLKHFYIRLGHGAFLCDPVTFIRNHPDYEWYWFYKQCKTVRQSPSLESVLVKSFWNQGAILFVPEGVHLMSQVELNGYLADLGVIFEDITIIIGKHSSARVSCYRALFGKGACYRVRSLTVLLQENAVLDFVLDERVSAESLYISEAYYELQQNASLQLLFVQTGSGFNKQRHEVVLTGTGAQADIRGISGVGKSGYHDSVTYQVHKAPATKSRVHARSLASGKARTAYQGLIHLQKSASGAEASQEHKAILLSKHARAWSIPSLEVLASNVSCAHASAVGTLDQEQIMYLRSRGISLERVRTLLLHAFLYDVLGSSSLDVHGKDIVKRVIKSAF